MSAVNYIIPVTYTAEDNETHINKDTILIKDCSQLGNPSPECDGYNFNRCPNDNAYCQPFIKGDVIREQYIIDNTKYKTLFVDIINSVTGEPEDSVVVTLQRGTDADRTDFLNVIIDTNQTIFDTLTCWFIKIKMYGCTLQGNDYNTCLDEKQVSGLTLAQAREECYEEMCEIADFIASEPYCVVRCEEPTLLIQGYYTDHDCNGNYYGRLASGVKNLFFKSIRVRGWVEPDGYQITETKNGAKKAKSKQTQRFFLITKGIPYYVADQIAVCMNGRFMYIDGSQYTGMLKLDKNFEEGSMWYVKENIYRECDEINFTCS